jgi:hypothetical protein
VTSSSYGNQQPQEPKKPSLWTKANRIAVVPLFALAVTALLTTTGVLSASTCEWATEVQTKSSAPIPKGKPLALSIRAGTNDIGAKLREGVTAGLKERGYTDLVDNPMTRPRAQVVVEEQTGRYTPFWAPLHLKIRVLMDTTRGKDDGGTATDAVILVDGKCTGLVTKDTWVGDWIPAAITEIVKALAPPA